MPPTYEEAELADEADRSQPKSTMGFAEIRPQIEQLPHGELLKAMAYLKHRLRAENPEYQRELAQRHADIEADRGVSLAEARKRMEQNG